MDTLLFVKDKFFTLTLLLSTFFALVTGNYLILTLSILEKKGKPSICVFDEIHVVGENSDLKREEACGGLVSTKMKSVYFNVNYLNFKDKTKSQD
ncbi:hypothetical protein [Metallosphaera javensis (ex Sakai et al. 2022)]|uniref:hypothetical protein n=1 Tax=Metallosphaera javensis (ex Sakai et al. 2022) TaxID=2775498 RepID=UPI00258ECA91|nr:MAG: hypothetical protein MjAS7_0105 [Metallosphaera javensis (ex Sakai et al. 2022)]